MFLDKFMDQSIENEAKEFCGEYKKIHHLNPTSIFFVVIKSLVNKWNKVLIVSVSVEILITNEVSLSRSLKVFWINSVLDA